MLIQKYIYITNTYSIFKPLFLLLFIIHCLLHLLHLYILQSAFSCSAENSPLNNITLPVVTKSTHLFDCILFLQYHTTDQHLLPQIFPPWTIHFVCLPFSLELLLL